MPQRLKPALLVLLLLLLTAVSAPAATITIRSDNWPPFNGDPKDAKAGYMVEVLQEIFTPLGHKIDYQLMSWDESLLAVREGKFNAVVGASIEDAPDFVFPRQSFGINGNSYFVKNGSSWKYEGIKSLSKVRLGIIDSYSYDSEIDTYIKTNQGSSKLVSVSGENALPTLIKMLLSGKLDVIVEDSNVMLYSLVKLRIPAGAVKKAGAMEEQVDLQIGFSPALKNSKEYARLFDEGLEKLRQSGRLKMILSRYGLTDWKK